MELRENLLSSFVHVIFPPSIPNNRDHFFKAMSNNEETHAMYSVGIVFRVIDTTSNFLGFRQLHVHVWDGEVKVS